MSGWLLDTNILSELRRPRPNAKVVRFVEEKPLRLLFASVVTFAEIRFGIENVDDASRRAELTDWLNLKVRPMFEDGQVLPVSEDVMLKWAAARRGPPKGRSHLLATRSHHRRDGAAFRAERGHTRHG